MFNLASNILKPLQLMKQVLTRTSHEGLHTASNSLSKPLLGPQTIDFTSIRTKVRCYFPRPNEVRRIRRHGYEKRMSTPGGRKILMRRILKGNHVLSH